MERQILILVMSIINIGLGVTLGISKYWIQIYLKKPLGYSDV